MSLHCGSLHVVVPVEADHSFQQRVVDVVTRHWIGLGARPLTSDPFALDRLAVTKTGKLGIAVGPMTEVPAGAQRFVTVVDSEHYTADPDLGAAIAQALNTTVLHIEFAGSTDSVMATAYGPLASTFKKQMGKSWDKVEAFSSTTVPHAFVHFADLRDDSHRDGFIVVGFEDISGAPRPNSSMHSNPWRDAKDLIPPRRGAYHGPSAADLAKQQAEARLRAEVEAAVHAGDTSDLPKQATDELLERLSKSNTNDPRSRQLLRHHADAFIADGAYWRLRVVAVAAAIDDDTAVLARVCTAMGHHAAGLGVQAVELLNNNNVSAGIRLLKQVVRAGNAPLTAFNNLAWALLRELGDVDEARDVTELCEQHGPQNPSIFHNTACVWVRLGDHDRALAAVHAAVRYHYEHLEKLRVDDDLLPIRDDPRFAAAFAQAPSIDPDSFTTTTTFKGEVVSLSRLVLRMDFFLPDGVPFTTGPALARALEVMRDAVPEGALGSYYKRGPWGAVTKATWTRAIKTLNSADGSAGIDFRVRGPATSSADESGGTPSPFGIVVDLWPDEMDGDKNNHPPSLSMWFPVDDALHGDVDHVVDTFRACVEAMPVVAASCGLHLLLRDTTYVETWWESHLLQARAAALLAQERHPFREWEDHTMCGVQWLSFANDQLVERCGGAAAVTQACGAAQVVSTSTGLLLRASLRPGLGQHRPPLDLGALPAVARAFSPVRIARKNMRAETKAHYARFDAVADTAFDNGAPSSARLSMPTLVWNAEPGTTNNERTKKLKR